MLGVVRGDAAERLARKRARYREYNRKRNSPEVLVSQSLREKRQRLAAGSTIPQDYKNDVHYKNDNTAYTQHTAQPILPHFSIFPHNNFNGYGIGGNNNWNICTAANYQFQLLQNQMHQQNYQRPISIPSAPPSESTQLIDDLVYNNNFNIDNVVYIHAGITDVTQTQSLPVVQQNHVLPQLPQQLSTSPTPISTPSTSLEVFPNHDTLSKKDRKVAKKMEVKSLHIKGWLQTLPESVQDAITSLYLETLTAEYHTKKGFHITIDAPYGEKACKPTPNVECRKVQRLYSAEDTGEVDAHGNIKRPSYATGTADGSVGILPEDYYTKGWEERHHILAQAVFAELKKHPELDISKMVIETPNSMVTLVYWNNRDKKYVNGDLKDEVKLGFHNDNNYDENGELKSGNTQKKHTPTCVLTIGDSRVLHMMERVYKGREYTKPAIIKYLLEHGDLFILHYADEVPKYRGGKSRLTKLYHGGVKFGKDGGMSGGLCLRSVDKYKYFDPETDVVANDNDKQEPARSVHLRRQRQHSAYIQSPDMLAQFERQKKLALETAAEYKFLN